MLDAKAMEFSVISLEKLIAQVEEESRLERKGIKGIASLTIKKRLRVHLIEVHEAVELVMLIHKW